VKELKKTNKTGTFFASFNLKTQWRNKMKFVFCLILMFIPFISYSYTCVDSKCHSNISRMNFQHGPVGLGQCNVCHIADEKNINQHISKPKSFIDFKYPKEKPLCVMCHDNKYNGNFIHDPVKNGDCTSCHNPHGGENKFFIKGKTQAETCFNCHENNKMVKSFLHGPIGTGECTSCHNPHASNYKFQLKNTGNELCFTCHSDKKSSFNKKVVHKPANENCTKCHDPHNSDTKFHLNASSEKDQCIQCHKEISPKVVASITNAKYPHKPVKDDKCSACHNPHATEHSKLLLADTKSICFQCHKDMGKKVADSKYIHGPVSSDGCYACHNTHGSENPLILVDFFPKEFYNDYKPDMYKLCFNCHNENAMTDKFTDKSTNFRNGNINLHFLHVQIKGKGRSCKACHEVHAGNQELHIRDSVPFGTGGWQLPIKYTKNKDGGTCTVGCHKPKTYNRVKEYFNN